MTLPIIDHVFVVQVESNSIVCGRIELVITSLLGHEIASPANGEMIDRLVWSEAALSPVEVNVFVSADQSGHPLQLFIAEIFRFQAAFPIRGSDKFGMFEYVFERRNVDRVQNLGFRSETVAYTFQKADGVEWFGLRAASSADHCGIGIGTNHSHGFHLAFIQRKQVS